MNKYFLILRGNNKKLATYEFETLWETYFNEKIKLSEIQNVLYSFQSKNLIDINHSIFQRLVYTNYLGLELTFGNSLDGLFENILSLDLEKFENGSFAIRFRKSKSGIDPKITQKDFAKIICKNLKNRNVDLENSDFEFNPIIYENQNEFSLCLKLFENQKDYAARMPKLRPVKMPYTLKSDMARASVNLLKLEKGVILDPFCGIGGILLEACDMNFKIIGNDISWNDLKYLKKNFEHYYPRAKYSRILADSTTRFLKENSIEGIVTDIPYGKASRKLGENLYENFLKQARIYLKPGKRLVIIYANFVEFKDLALKYFKEIEEIDEYINKSMTRHILILENNN